MFLGILKNCFAFLAYILSNLSLQIQRLNILRSASDLTIAKTLCSTHSKCSTITQGKKFALISLEYSSRDAHGHVGEKRKKNQRGSIHLRIGFRTLVLFYFYSLKFASLLQSSNPILSSQSLFPIFPCSISIYERASLLGRSIKRGISSCSKTKILPMY